MVILSASHNAIKSTEPHTHHAQFSTAKQISSLYLKLAIISATGNDYKQEVGSFASGGTAPGFCALAMPTEEQVLVVV